MPLDAVAFTEANILAERVRLVVRHQVSAVVPVMLIVVLLLWALTSDVDTWTIRVWAILTTVALGVTFREARRNIAVGITVARAPSVVRRLMLERCVFSALWVSLGWFTLGHASTTHSFLVLAVIAGVAGGAVATFSPLPSVFVVFLVPVLVSMALKLWFMGDPDYYALGATFLLYLVALLGQCRDGAQAVRRSIDLQFENIELMKQLRQKTELAEVALREAQQANNAKSKFLAAASHDLRQPIHALGLFHEVLSSTALDAHQHELLGSAVAAGKATAEMLNTLLDFSRIEAGVIEPRLLSFRVQPLLNKIEREFSQQADAKGLAYRCRESPLVLNSDPALVELILRNLVSNAIHYTESGGVLVTCRRRAGRAVVEIWDTGIGIAAAQQQEVFREFHQLGNPDRDSSKGLGLGLAIVQGLAEILEHTVTLQSTPRRGSVFRLSLPLALPGLTDVEPVVVEPVVVMKSLPLHILILDDDEAVRRGMQHLLRSWGCTCELARTVDEALAMAGTLNPDVVISDYQLGEGRSGIDAIRALRLLLGEDVSALLVTGDTAPARLREAQLSGIAVLHKPVSAERLFERLSAVVNGRGSAPSGTRLAADCDVVQ